MRRHQGRERRRGGRRGLPRVPQHRRPKNVFYKTNTKLGGCELAAMVVGANAPCVLSSRGDSSLTKLYSIALAALNVK